MNEFKPRHLIFECNFHTPSCECQWCKHMTDGRMIITEILELFSERAYQKSPEGPNVKNFTPQLR